MRVVGTTARNSSIWMSRVGIAGTLAGPAAQHSLWLFRLSRQFVSRGPCVTDITTRARAWYRG